MNKIDCKELETLFNLFQKNNKKIYLVGGSVRDYLLGKSINDFDMTTPVKPSEVVNLLKDEFELDTYRINLGNVVAKKNNIRFEITTFRYEIGVKDVRYPRFMGLTKSMKLDSLRRDFTINALYMDYNYQIYDPTHHGLADLKANKLRFIGNPIRRIKEDPLRVIRLIRFACLLNFDIDQSLYETLIKNASLVNMLKEVRFNELFKIFEIDNISLLKKYLDILSLSFKEISKEELLNIINSTYEKNLRKYYFIKAVNNNKLFTLSKKDLKLLETL